MPQIKKISLLFIVVFFSLSCFSFAGDLDDGISKATDDGISGWDDLGKGDKNTNFIVLKAKSKADVARKNGQVAGTESTGANMNSVVMGAGSNVRGDIYIIDQSTGDKTNVSD